MLAMHDRTSAALLRGGKRAKRRALPAKTAMARSRSGGAVGVALSLDGKPATATEDGSGAMARLYSARELRYSPAMALTGKQRRHLRGLGHALTPVAQVGKGGVSDAVVAAIDRALTDHELVKIKLLETLDLDRTEAASLLASRTNASVAQVLGRTVLLYRPDPEAPRLQLPKSSGPNVNDA
jgi:RNA-binding protein